MGIGDEDGGQDVEDLESVVKENCGSRDFGVVLHISCDTFLCMSVHHNNKQHNGGSMLLLREFRCYLVWILPSEQKAQERRKFPERVLPLLWERLHVKTCFTLLSCPTSIPRICKNLPLKLGPYIRTRNLDVRKSSRDSVRSGTIQANFLPPLVSYPLTLNPGTAFCAFF